MATEWARDYKTGDYVCANGRPVMAATQPGGADGPPVFTRTRVKRKRWLYAPDDQYGSDFYLYNRANSTEVGDPLAENLMRQCLAPMTLSDGDGRIDNLEVTTGQQQRGGVLLDVRYSDRRQRDQAIVVTPIGS